MINDNNSNNNNNNSLCGDNNLISLHLWWREIVLKSEKVYKFFVQNCLKNFLLVFICLKMSWNPKNYQFLVEKSKSLHKYCPVATGTALSPKFRLDTKLQNSVFWKISYSDFFCNWVALNINLKSKWDFSNSKSTKNVKSRIWTELEIKICFLRQSWSKGWRQKTVLQLIFGDFLTKSWNFLISSESLIS